jgi:hypothetical protein
MTKLHVHAYIRSSDKLHVLGRRALRIIHAALPSPIDKLRARFHKCRNRNSVLPCGADGDLVPIADPRNPCTFQKLKGNAV